MSDTGPLAPGWYLDPAGSGEHRWWDGAAWTGQTRRAAPPGGLRLPGTPVAPEPAFDPTRAGGRARWPYVLAIALVACVLGIGGCTALVGVAVFRAADDLERTTALVRAEVRVVDCRAGELGGVTVAGTAVNGSAVRSDYVVEVRVVAGDGIGSTTVRARATAVDPGQTASWRVAADSAALDLPVRCVIGDVTRSRSRG